MSKGLYLIWEIQFKNVDKYVYKFGKTENIFKRTNTYPKGSEVLFWTTCNDIDKSETEILDILNKNCVLYTEGEYKKSRERFSCNNPRIIINIIMNYLNLHDNPTEFTDIIQKQLFPSSIENKKQKEEKQKQKEEKQKQKEEKQKQKEAEKIQNEAEKIQKEAEKIQKEAEKIQKEEEKKQKEEEKQKDKEKQKIKIFLNDMLRKKLKERCKNEYITYFIADNIIIDTTGSISNKELNEQFKEWFQMNLGNRKAPKLLEIAEIMIKKFGNRNYKTNKWHGIKFKNDDDPLDVLDELNNY